MASLGSSSGRAIASSSPLRGPIDQPRLARRHRARRRRRVLPVAECVCDNAPASLNSSSRHRSAPIAVPTCSSDEPIAAGKPSSVTRVSCRDKCEGKLCQVFLIDHRLPHGRNIDDCHDYLTSKIQMIWVCGQQGSNSCTAKVCRGTAGRAARSAGGSERIGRIRPSFHGSQSNRRSDFSGASTAFRRRSPWPPASSFYLPSCSSTKRSGSGEILM